MKCAWPENGRIRGKMARIGKVGFVQDPNERFRLSFVTKLTAAGDGQSNAAG